MPSPADETLVSEKLRYYREVRGLSQTELGQLIGMNAGTIINWEKQFNPIHYSDAIRLSEILNISSDELLDEHARFCKPGYGARIKIIRQAYKVSQAAFAKLVECKRSVVSIWEAEINETHPSKTAFYKLKQLALEKDVEFEQLIDDYTLFDDGYTQFVSENCSKKITTIRLAYGVNKQDFGKLLGLKSKSTVGLWESGKIVPSRQSYELIVAKAREKGIDLNDA